MTTPQNVVITGASAGIGRATARLFGARGDRVALLARGRGGLDGAVKDIESAGGRALAIPTDVADPGEIETAANAVEETFGPIDVWVNVAFTSVFAPFHEISPDEYRRVTDVSYLGYVHGTMAALSRMRPRDRGTIVQVGSALGTRAIPLQSAYCGCQTRDQRVHRIRAHRVVARPQQRPHHHRADACGQHATVLLGTVPAAASPSTRPAYLPT